MRRETKTWVGRRRRRGLGRLRAGVHPVPRVRALRPGADARAAARSGRAARPQPRAGRRQRAPGARGRGAARRTGGHRARGARRARVGAAGEIVVDLSGATQRRCARAGADTVAQVARASRDLEAAPAGGFHVGRAGRASLAFVVCARVRGAAVARAGSPTCACPAPTCARVAAAARADAACWRSRSPRACAPPSGAAPPRREAISDAELGLVLLTTVYLLLALSGGVGVVGLPAGLRGGQLPRHLPPAGGRAAAGGGGHRLRGGAVLRPHRAARARRRRSRPRRLHRRVRAAQRRLPARRGGAPAPRAPPPRRGRGRVDARGGARLPPHLDGAVAREPRAHARRGAGEAVAGIDRDHPPAALLQPGAAAHGAGAAHLRAAVARRVGRAPQGQGAVHRLAARRRGGDRRRAAACWARS